VEGRQQSADSTSHPCPQEPVGGEATVQRDTSVTALMSLVANALSWGGSRVYLREFGVGTNEWRVLSALVNWPGGTASHIGQVLGLNKSVVSRSLKFLEERGMVTIEQGTGRRQLLQLTPAGRELHDRVIVVVLKRERILLEGFSPSEVEQLLDFLRRMHANVPAMNAYDPSGT
jgi:DNA-binding MarR family transcriptional regulator